MADVLCFPVLVLNRYFQPVQITNVRRAFVLLYGGSAVAVEGGELYDFPAWRELPAGERPGLAVVGGQLRVPRVLHLLRYDRTPRTLVRLSRRNLMLRDDFQCQYCGRRPPLRDLNIDHIVPRSRGGADSWDNLVTACRSCNLRKGSRTPEEAGVPLLRPPSRPRWTVAARIRMAMGHPFPEWEPFLETG
jgi:5-methylcytosine-specific restriction endonuclease McrA